MVWGCLTATGTGRLYRIEGKLNAAGFVRILDTAFLSSLEDHGLDSSAIIFQQDNDPKHTSRLAKNWFRNNHIELLPWPASSPDMNIIEHAWEVLERQVRSRSPLPRNLEELWVALVEEWERLDMVVVRGLYDSMPRRLAALKAAKGSYTKY